MDIHENHIRIELIRELYGLGAVLRLADDLEVGLAVEDQAEADPDEFLIVNEENSDRIRRRAGAGRRRLASVELLSG
ncbi:hypothetical protein [Leucobacter edaphi]|uniref:hypothetical protein n=1 Tax=Leucobacter edaphi TaxID=2796472 RepID=UPI0034E22872